MKPKRIRPEAQEIIYPDSDGQPIAENTRQFRLIVTIQGNLDALFVDRPDVFVGGDLLWYARQGDPTERLAPDVMVAFGRPKGDRASYKQWEEGGIAPQVIWEVLSPANTSALMAEKRNFYQRYGVQEYYEYDPDCGHLRGWLRNKDVLEPILLMQGHVSKLLGVRMELDELGGLVLYRPDGRRFMTFVELDAAVREVQNLIQRERLAKEEARRRTNTAEASTKAMQEKAVKLAARLRALGIDPDQP
jgi:Uma2 family endonuclease